MIDLIGYYSLAAIACNLYVFILISKRLLNGEMTLFKLNRIYKWWSGLIFMLSPFAVIMIVTDYLLENALDLIEFNDIALKLLILVAAIQACLLAYLLL